MSSAPQTPDPETNDNQPSMEIDWPSDIDLSTFIDMNAYYSDSTLETAQQGIEEPYPEIQSTAEETQETPAEGIQPTRNASPRLVDNNASAPDLIGSTVSQPSEPLVQASPGMDTASSERESNPLTEPEQVIVDQLLFLRYKLQKGLFPEGRQPKAKAMHAMSLYLGKLENITSPPWSAILATSIHKLLKKIKNQGEIPRDGEFHFKERATGLLGKWMESLKREEQLTMSSTTQPTSDRSIELNALPDTQRPASSPKAQTPLRNTSETPVTDSTEECEPEMASRPELYYKPASDHGTELGTIHAKQQLFPSPTIQSSSKTTSHPLVIDLTEEDQPETVTGSEPSCQPTSNHSAELSAVQGVQRGRSSPPSSTTDSKKLVPFTILENNSSPRSHATLPNTRKRKHCNSAGYNRVPASNPNTGEPDTVHLSNVQGSTLAAAAKLIHENTPRRRQPKRNTSPREHLTNEVLWMSPSVTKMEGIIKLAEKEIDAIWEKRAKFLVENAKERELAMDRRDGFIELKEYLLAWGAQDEKVTEEWECRILAAKA